MIARLDTARRSTFPFGMGWQGHFPWNTAGVLWKYSDNQAWAQIGGNGTVMLITMRYSKTNQKQEIFLNGTSIFDHPRTNDYGTGNMAAFSFPDISSFDSTWGTEWTVGEITVIKGILNDNNRKKLEGYLAHKWSLNSLPTGHPYKNSRPTTNESPLTSDTPFDHGQAIDLANGHIEVTTGGSAFNGGSDFTISVWTKGWPSEVNASVISKGSPTTHPSIGGWMIGTGSGTNH